MSKFYRVKRDDSEFNGSITDIPVDHWPMTKKLHPQWVIIDEMENALNRMEDPQPVEPPQATPALQCPLCDFIPKNERSLNLHKLKKHS